MNIEFVSFEKAIRDEKTSLSYHGLATIKCNGMKLTYKVQTSKSGNVFFGAPAVKHGDVWVDGFVFQNDEEFKEAINFLRQHVKLDEVPF